MAVFWVLGGLLGVIWMPVTPDFGSLMSVMGDQNVANGACRPFCGGSDLYISELTVQAASLGAVTFYLRSRSPQFSSSFWLDFGQLA